MHVMDIDDQQAAIRDLIRRMMEKTGLDATGLAREAGISPSTLSRFLYQPVKHLLTARTLAKLSTASGVPVPVGSPLTSALEREVLAGLRSTDEQGQAMILRLVRSLRLGSQAEPANEPPVTTTPNPRPRERAPPSPITGGNVARIPTKPDCGANVAVRRVPRVVDAERGR
jgi:hypothetical protein